MKVSFVLIEDSINLHMTPTTQIEEGLMLHLSQMSEKGVVFQIVHEGSAFVLAEKENRQAQMVQGGLASAKEFGAIFKQKINQTLPDTDY